MNNDLISRNAAIEIIRSMTINLGGKDIFTPEAKKSVIGVLDEIDAVDAEPVRRGKWKYYSPTMMECSICKRHASRHKFKYCPNCGAKMDAEVSGDE